MSPVRHSAHRAARTLARRGFTILETMMALVIIGVGVLAFVDAQAAFTASNNWSSRAATGMLLANEVRELTRRLPRHDPVTGLSLSGSGGAAVLVGWGREGGEVAIADLDDLDDFDGITFGDLGTFAGPIDAFGNIVPDLNVDGSVRTDAEGAVAPLLGWSQTVTVQKVSLYNYDTVLNNAATQAATAQMAGAAVGAFPLRVTVVVNFTEPSTGETSEVTRITWVVPVE